MKSYKSIITECIILTHTHMPRYPLPFDGEALSLFQNNSKVPTDELWGVFKMNGSTTSLKLGV